MDWAQTSPSAQQTDIFLNRVDGQAWDLDDNDDVNQWVVVLARIDSPEDFQDLRDQGELAINYGAYFVYRTQNWDQRGVNLGAAPDPALFEPRSAKAYIPDAWVKLGHKKFEAEAEAVAVIGSIGSLADVGVNLPMGEESFKVRQYGGVARIGYKLLDDSLRLGAEVGYASGDQWDNSPQGSTNVRDARTLPGPDDVSINAFRFDFDYEVDLILFRELIGTVTNATYVKPTLAWDITDRITFKTQLVMSFANKPVATPGNGLMYGVELDGDLGYRNEGFFAGISYGVLFPLGAMNHPPDTEFGYGLNSGDAGNAQTIQTRLMLSF
jgi:uncharacterized protein (TIGR04551 family)